VCGYAEMLRLHRVLPWVVVGMDHVIGWPVEGDDPDAWSVVVGDAHSSELHIYRMPTAEFLRASPYRDDDESLGGGAAQS
jgi:hypothetical protein